MTRPSGSTEGSPPVQRRKTPALRHPPSHVVESLPTVATVVVKSGCVVQVRMHAHDDERVEAVAAFPNDPRLADLYYHLARELHVSLTVELTLPVEPTACSLAAAAILYQRIHATSGTQTRIVFGGPEPARTGPENKEPGHEEAQPSTLPSTPQIPRSSILGHNAAQGQTLQVFLRWLSWTNRLDPRELRHVAQSFIKKGIRVRDIDRMEPWKWPQISITPIFGSQVSEAARQYLAVVDDRVRDVRR